jgi:hypothetical protein
MRSFEGQKGKSQKSKQNKKSLDAFLAFQLKPRLVSNSIYEKEIHFAIRTCPP